MKQNNTDFGIPQDNSPAKPLSITQLESAFDVFNRVSIDLDTSYKDLEKRVVELNEEVAQKNTELLSGLSEKDQQIDRLQSLISVLPSGVVVLDKTATVCEVNEKAKELLGEPLMGISWSGVVARVAVPEIRNGFELKLRDGRILSITSRSLKGTKDRVIMITEVTSIHHLQERANRDKRLTALGEMAANLAHQIRTPLSSALLYCSQLSLNHLPDEARVPMAGKVQERLSHMSKLVDSTLDFVRGAKPSSEVISVKDLVEKTGQLVRMIAIQNHTTVTFSDCDESLLLLGDIDALSGALTNLIVNAIEITTDDAWVKVSVKKLSGREVEIHVSDNGPGILPDHLDNIFDPFFTTRPQGTGLGLSVVAMTAAVHRGEIRCKNREGGGAVFTLRLPLFNTSEKIRTNNNKFISDKNAISAMPKDKLVSESRKVA